MQKDKIKYIRVSKTCGISQKDRDFILGKDLNEVEKKEIDRVIKRVLSEYGTTLKLLSRTDI